MLALRGRRCQEHTGDTGSPLGSAVKKTIGKIKQWGWDFLAHPRAKNAVVELLHSVSLPRFSSEHLDKAELDKNL